MESIELEDRKTLSQKVYEKLKLLILKGEIKSGTRVTEANIANLFGVSVTPVREAFKKLSSECLIEVSSWKGGVVKGVSQKDLLDIFQCRYALESLASSLVCKNITEGDLELLDSIIERSKNTEDIKLLVELNKEFHGEIVRISGNLKLKQLMDELMTVISYAREAYNRYVLEHKEILNEHTEIVGAFRENNPEKASILLKVHIEKSYSKLIGNGDEQFSLF